MGKLNYTTEKTNELLAKVESLPEQVAEGSSIVLETGETTTLEPGENATSEVVDNGVDDDGKHKYKLNFGIPKGAPGEKGDDGKTPVLEAGKTTTLAAGQSATAEVVANGQDTAGNPKYKLNFGIPKGADGSGGSGGGGNVYADPAGLLASKQYAFKPSADNSVTGQFVEVQATAGGGAVNVYDILGPLMDGSVNTISEENYNKLKGYIEGGVPLYMYADGMAMSPYVYLSEDGLCIVLELISGSTAVSHSEILIKESDKSVVWFQDYIPFSTTLIHFTTMNGYQKPSSYTAIDGGDLLGTAIGKLEAGLNALQESGGSGSSGESDVYVLPSNLATLASGATDEEIVEAFGGTDKIKEIINLLNSNSIVRFVIRIKAFLIYNADVYSLLGTNITISYFNTQKGYIHIIKIGKSGSNGLVKIIYPGGYTLKYEVAYLSSNSTSEEVSTAVGGESGIKEIVYAVKGGNQLKINSDTTNEYGSIFAIMQQAKETDTELGFVISAFGGTFGAKYNKSTKVFTFIDNIGDLN